VIEAGRGKKLNVPTDALGGITAKAFQPLLEMIKTRVPAQNFGYNQAAWVRARRKAY
jgi:hypothetical protein